MSKKSKVAGAILLIAVAVAAIAALTVGKKYYITRVKQISLQETRYLYITDGDNARSVLEKIEDIVEGGDAEGFAILAEHNRFDSRKHSGKFAVKDGDTMKDIYYRIVSNTQTPVKLIVPSTRTIPQLIGAISRQLMLDSAELSRYTSNAAYYNRIGYSKATLPSLFIPETYEVYWNIKPEDLMVRFMKERTRFWNDERRAKAEAIGMTPEEVATLASIVDEETNNSAEMPIVAGLYINRLKKGMPLQADPTVKFAIGDPARKRILKKDLETDSKYNTYKHNGLPPGPIRIPSKQALESVLNYKQHNYLYMCAKEDFSGTHNFAKTLAEHNANARRYQQALDKLKIKK
ncbi:MAG: endolytic transglycosylase MltG [Bacteroidaceae bacterium]|nr:endolytic transglycosylase MltG [Bacteroidaceae bacterium]